MKSLSSVNILIVSKINSLSILTSNYFHSFDKFLTFKIICENFSLMFCSLEITCFNTNINIFTDFLLGWRFKEKKIFCLVNILGEHQRFSKGNSLDSYSDCFYRPACE